MSFSLSDILSAVQTNHKRDDRESVARVGVLLAIQEIPKYHDFEALRTSIDIELLAEGGYVDIPSNYLKMREVRLMNGVQSYKLPLINRERVLRDFPDPDSFAASYSEMCYIEGTKLYIVPRSAIPVLIRLNYNILPSFIDGDDTSTMSPDIPLIDRFLISYATGWVFKSLQMFQEAQIWSQSAGQDLDSVINFDLRKPAEDRHVQPFMAYDVRYGDPLDPFNFCANSSFN